MSDDRFFERLRDEAQKLRYEADDVAVTRLRARVRARIARPLTVADLLARWVRPIAFALGTLAIVGSLGIYYVESHETLSLETAVTRTSTEVQMAGASLGNE